MEESKFQLVLVFIAVFVLLSIGYFFETIEKGWKKVIPSPEKDMERL